MKCIFPYLVLHIFTCCNIYSHPNRHIRDPRGTVVPILKDHYLVGLLWNGIEYHEIPKCMVTRLV